MRMHTTISLLLSLVLLALPAAGFAGERTLLEPGTSDGEIVHMHPGKVDPSRLPLDSIQDLHTTGTPPEVDLNSWRLVVTREKEELLSLPFRRIIRMETVKKKVLLICPGWFADYAEWEGVPLSELLELAGVEDDYRRIVFHGMDGYSSSFDREEVRENFLYLAHRVNGERLPLEHGFPLRLVAEDVLGGRWVKWVSRIEVR